MKIWEFFTNLFNADFPEKRNQVVEKSMILAQSERAIF